MRQVTRKFMSGNAAEATAAIQKSLKEKSTHSGAGTGAGGPNMQQFMKDLMPDKNVTPDITGAQTELPQFVTDLLQRLGVPAQGAPNVSDISGDAEQHSPTSDKARSDTTVPGQFLSKSFTNQAGTRTYRLYIPSTYKGQAMPLMVMLHGCTQNADDFAKGTGMNAVAEESQCFVVYPNQTQAANSSKCWNWFKSVDQQRDQGEPSIIAGITQTVIDDYKLDAGKVYVAGLSAGGAMAIIMGTAYPDMYAAVGVHSGLPYAAAHDLPSALAAMKGSAAPAFNQRSANAQLKSIPIIVFHGDRDATVSPRNSETLMAQSVPEYLDDELAQKGEAGKGGKPVVIVEEGKVPNGHTYTRTSHHDRNGRAMGEHWLIHGAGHAWAGGSKTGSYTDGRGPDATREMMRFFSTQSRA
ncbi:PHB depolymerase family esterase [Glaciimonas immobilis]|nr:PHB depolymerase family esterase [Glaciimonas immobilis]